ncbi:MAG: formylglycine-generating enzyme family protein, partial [Anaerolineales bacterium]|nr:formylglycine-generating enzyme family protein [Anaerolineales bacterium]
IVRLPTETEWVRAAGGQQNDRYPWDSPVIARSGLCGAERSRSKQSPSPDSEIASQKTLAMTLARANVKESEIGGTTPVAMYPDGKRVTENGGEIWDLAGNVWEWTSTTFEEPYSGAYLRGGSWWDKAESAGVRARADNFRGSVSDDLGWRVVVASRIFPRS